MEHRRSLLVGLALAVALVAGSSPRVVGDGDEYSAQALNFASLRGPSFDPADIPSLDARIAAADPRLADWSILEATIASQDGRRDFVHFWFYALVATPAVWVTRALGANPTWAFTLLNVALFPVGLRVCLPRLGPAACLLLFGGPNAVAGQDPRRDVHLRAAHGGSGVGARASLVVDGGVGSGGDAESASRGRCGGS